MRYKHININNFLQNFNGGARTDLFECWIDLPDAIKPKILASLATTTAKQAMQAAFTGDLSAIYQKTNNALSDLFSTVTGGHSRYMAKSAKLPKSETSTVPVQYKGRPFPFDTTRNDETTIPVQFYNDTDMLIRNALEIWNQEIRSTQTNVGGYPTALWGTLKVYVHDQLGNVLKVHKFVGARPTLIGEIQLSWDSENIQVFDTTWSYSYQLTDTSK